MTGKKRTTRADVAKYAQVSETIVSYVVNNNRYVNSEKRKRVEEAVAALNYRPNNIARALSGKKSNQIIFIADQITNEYFGRIVKEMDEFAYSKGYLISLCSNRNTTDFISQVISRQYDGIIISSASFPEEYVKQFVDANIPVVLFMNRRYHNLPKQVGIIDSGLYSGAKECVKHLIEQGSRKLLYLDRVSSRGAKSNKDDLRLSGFIDQVQESGLDLSQQRIISGCYSEKEVEAEIIKRIENGLKVDGIFGRNDMLACIGLNTIRKMGLRVPEDVAIIGFDNSSISKLCHPTLSTMEMQRESISKVAMGMLQNMIDRENIPLKASFKTNLIKRESTSR